MRTFITLVFIVTMAGAVFGQGTIFWGGFNPAYITAETNTTQMPPVLGGFSWGAGTHGPTGSAASGSAFYYALLYQPFAGTPAVTPTGLAELNAWQDTGLMASNSAPGRLAAINPSTAAIVPLAPGSTNNIMLVGWSANLGSSWAQVSGVLNNWDLVSATISQNAFFGMSGTGYISVSSANPGVQAFGDTGINSPNTQLYSLFVPEPGTIALACLGGALLAAPAFVSLRCGKPVRGNARNAEVSLSRRSVAQADRKK